MIFEPVQIHDMAAVSNIFLFSQKIFEPHPFDVIDSMFPNDLIFSSLATTAPGQILADRQVDGSYFVNKTKSCLTCQNNTHPNAAGDRCVFCEQFFATNSNCECSSEILDRTGGVCLKSKPPGNYPLITAGHK